MRLVQVDPEQALPTVLVLDDDVDNLRTFQRVFRKKFRILAALSAEEALALLDTSEPEVAFVDYTMPKVNGVEFLTMLRERRPEVARYLLTGYGDLDDITRFRNTDLFAGVLNKPWDRADIEGAVAAAVLTRRKSGAG